MTANELDRWFRSFLRIAELAGVDNSPNGLQVGRADREIARIAFAVDACLETMRRAASSGAQMLFVHHGLFWGKHQQITGTLYERIRLLVENDLCLYAAHLPLDQHLEYGNNAVLAARLGLQDVVPFGWYKGVQIGVKGRLPQPLRFGHLVQQFFGPGAAETRTLPFGPDTVQTVGIVSGGAPYEVEQAITEGLDAYITGEASHSIYHQCQEGGINVLFGGHYATETAGVQALAQKVKAELGIETLFIDVPTGL